MSDTVTEPEGWAVQHTPAAAAAATITKAASALGRHVCRHITCSLGGVGANAASIIFVLRDGATGAGTILWTAAMSNLANTTSTMNYCVNIAGSKNTAMTLETTASAGATSQASVAMDGYTIESAV